MTESACLYHFSLEGESSGLSAWLTDEERARAARFHFEKDRSHWIAARAGLRLLLAGWTGLEPCRVAIETEPAGKPFVAGRPVHFSLSHSGGQAAVVLSKFGPVGVDLEPLGRPHKLADCLDTFCHPEERKDRSGQALLRIWCAKEAYLKALGVGLAMPPAGLCLEPQGDGTFFIRSEIGCDLAIRIHFPAGAPDFCVAVALPADLACPGMTEFDLHRDGLRRWDQAGG